jgi:hypothetical protein
MMFDVVRMGGKRAGWGRCSRPKCDVIGVWMAPARGASFETPASGGPSG